MNRLGIIVSAAMLTITAPMASGYELKNITYRTGDIGKVVFSHKDHLRQKTIRNNCKACHREGTNKLSRHSMAELEQGKSCGACHNGTRAFAITACDRCHPARQVTLKDKGVGTIIFSHKSHFQRERCESCHAGIFRAGPNRPVGMAAMEKGKSCGACHDRKTAFGLEKCTSCHPAAEVSYRNSGGTVIFSHELHLGMYGCRECHGGIYGTPGKRLTAGMAEMEKGKSCGSCHDDRQAFTVKGNCARCHKVV
ncbi:MAG TPA: cytochrome c3 family protein [Geobacteraceae bacterium]|nr:cytochrome c3 family protein [Geobacteraceae bacterium]